MMVGSTLSWTVRCRGVPRRGRKWRITCASVRIVERSLRRLVPIGKVQERFCRFSDPWRSKLPPLEELLARRRKAPGSDTGSEDARRPPGARFPLAWAATVVLAIGSGWIARGVLMGPPTEGRTEVEVASVSESPAEPTLTADADEPPSGLDAEPVQVAGAEPAQLTAAQPAPRVLKLSAASAPPVSQAVSGVRSRAALDVVGASASDLPAIEALLSQREANATAMSAWVAATPAEAGADPPPAGRTPMGADGDRGARWRDPGSNGPSRRG